MSEPQPGAAGVVTKGEFAALCSVDKSRVSQWIRERKITGEAIVGAGWKAKINVVAAKAQLRERLDIGRRLGNGLSTRLQDEAPAPVVSAPPEAPPMPSAAGDLLAAVVPPAPPLVPDDPVEAQIKREKLEQLQRYNRNQARLEFEKVGRLTDAELAQQQYGRLAATLISTFDEAIPELANTLASRPNLNERDLMHLLRLEFRRIRSAAAVAIKRSLADMPKVVMFDLGDEVETETV